MTARYQARRSKEEQREIRHARSVRNAVIDIELDAVIYREEFRLWKGWPKKEGRCKDSKSLR
jgi:hypothetical protein